MERFGTFKNSLTLYHSKRGELSYQVVWLVCMWLFYFFHCTKLACASINKFPSKRDCHPEVLPGIRHSPRQPLLGSYKDSQQSAAQI